MAETLQLKAAWLDQANRQLLHDYLTTVSSVCGYITIQPTPSCPRLQLPLHKVYIALKGDTATSLERYFAALLLEDEVSHLSSGADEQKGRDNIRTELLSHNPYSLSLMDQGGYQPDTLRFRAAARQHNDSNTKTTIDLGEAFRRERVLVILGDPGSGKTTLARWLTYKLAHSMVNGQEQVQVPKDQVNPEYQESDTTEESKLSGNADADQDEEDVDTPGNASATSSSTATAAASADAAMPPERLVGLGPVRVPVLVRISDFADALRQDDKLTLAKYLGKLYLRPSGRLAPRDPADDTKESQDTLLGPLFLKALEHDNLVLVLDGLDEIVAREMRRKVVRAVESFVARHVTCGGMPALEGGNQVLVTSRIVGYHAFPLQSRGKGTVAHVTVQKMGDSSIDHFIDCWVAAVQPLLSQRKHLFQSTTPSRRSRRMQGATRMAKALKASLHDKGRVGLIDLARNPLLLTIIAMVYVNSGSLPEQRSVLYQHAISLLLAVWYEPRASEDNDAIATAPPVTLAEIDFVLPHVAYFMHEHYSSGLLPEDVLREQLLKHLKRFHSQPPSYWKCSPSNFQSLLRTDTSSNGSSINTDSCAPLSIPLEKRVEAFMARVRSCFGVMTERGERLYGFVHLTFEEYLAGRALLLDERRNPSDACANVLAKLDAPRWREPIILGLGHAHANWERGAFGQLVRALLALTRTHEMLNSPPITSVTEPSSLSAATARMKKLSLSPSSMATAAAAHVPAASDEKDQADGALRPQAPLLIARAISEMHDMDPSILVSLLHKLLCIQADPVGRTFASLIDDIDQAFVSLHKRDPVRVKTFLAAMIADPQVHDTGHWAHLSAPDPKCVSQWLHKLGSEAGTVDAVLEVLQPKDTRVLRFSRADMACAACTLVHKHQWITEDVALALTVALQRHWDRGQWQWIIHSTLRDLVSCSAAFHKAFASERTNSATEDIHARVDRRLNALVFGRHMLLPASRYPLRVFLQDAKGAQTLSSNPASAAWLQLIVALYGGYQDFQLPQVKQDYNDCVSYLQMESQDREPYAEFFRYYWKGDNTIWTIAVHLDSQDRFQSLRLLQRAAPNFSSEYLWRDTPLSRPLMRALQAGESVEQFVKFLWKAVRAEESDANLLVHSIVALGVVGEDISVLFPDSLRVLTTGQNTVTPGSDHKVDSDDEEEPLGHELERAQLLGDLMPRAPLLLLLAPVISAEFHCVMESLKDPVIRSAKPLSALLRQLAPAISPERWKDTVRTVSYTMLSCGTSLDLKVLFPCAADSVKPYVLAELWAKNIVSISDDALYATAAMLDTYWVGHKQKGANNSSGSSTAKTASSAKDTGGFDDAVFVKSLYYLHQSVYLEDALVRGQSTAIRFAWTLNHLPLCFDSPADQFLEVYDVFSGSNPGLSLARSTMWDKLKGFLARSSKSEISVEVLVYYLAHQGSYMQKDYWYWSKNSVGQDKWYPRTELLGMADLLQDPYYRGRALLSSVVLFPDLGHDVRLVQRGFDCIALVDQPVRRAVMYQMVCNAIAMNPHRNPRATPRSSATTSSSTGNNSSGSVTSASGSANKTSKANARGRVLSLDDMVDLALEEARHISHAENRVRFTARMALYCRAGKVAKILRELLTFIATVSPERVRSVCLLVIEPQCVAYPELHRRVMQLATALHDPWLRANVLKTPAAHLVAAPQYHHRAEWALITLCCRASYLRQRFQAGAEQGTGGPHDLGAGFAPPAAELWRALLDPTTADYAFAKLRETDRQGGLQLNRLAAQVCEVLRGRGEDITRLVALVTSADMEVMPLVTRWFLEAPWGLLKHYCAVMLAEVQELSLPLLPSVLELLSHHSSWYHRARIVLAPSTGVRSHRPRFSSRLGQSFLESIAAALETSTNAFVGHSLIKLLAHSVIWDDAHFLFYLLEVVVRYDMLRPDHHHGDPEHDDEYKLGTASPAPEMQDEWADPATQVDPRHRRGSPRLVRFLSSLSVSTMHGMQPEQLQGDEEDCPSQPTDPAEPLEFSSPSALASLHLNPGVLEQVREASLLDWKNPSHLDVAIALRLMTSVEALTDSVWLVLKHGMTMGTPNVQRALLRQIMMMVTVSTSLSAQSAKLYNNFTDYNGALEQFEEAVEQGRLDTSALMTTADEVLIGGPVEIATSILFALQEWGTLHANESSSGQATPGLGMPLRSTAVATAPTTDVIPGVQPQSPEETKHSAPPSTPSTPPRLLSSPSVTSMPSSSPALMRRASSVNAARAEEERMRPLVQLAEQFLAKHFGSHLHTVVAQAKSGKEVLNHFRVISDRNMYHYPPEEVSLAQYASSLVLNNLVAFRLLVVWMTVELERFRRAFYQRRAARPRVPGSIKTTLRHLMTLVAASAEKLPSTFLKIACWPRLAPLLVFVIRNPMSCRTKRQSAISILSFMHRINREVFGVLKFVCQEAALVGGPGVPKIATVASRFQIADLDLDILFDGLYDSDSYVAYITAQILQAIGCNPSLPSAIQNTIVRALTKASYSPRSDRTIHPSYVAYRIPRLMTLQHAFFAALRTILSNNASMSVAEQVAAAGVSSKSRPQHPPKEENPKKNSSPLSDMLFALLPRNDRAGVQRLLSLGASIYSQNEAGKSPVEVAHENKCGWFIRDVIKRNQGKDRLCVCCLTNPVTTMFLPCTHMVACDVCCTRLRKKRCPTCRTKFTTVLHCAEFLSPDDDAASSSDTATHSEKIVEETEDIAVKS